MSDITNIIVAGLGGQGVITASNILADAVFRAGLDVKMAEVHGMSQRGGSVSTDVRFGLDLSGASPMVPAGQADFMLVADADQIEVNRHNLRPHGVLVEPTAVDAAKLPHPRSLNVALLGVLSRRLPIDPACWIEAIKANLAPKLHEMNVVAFNIGRGERA